jgi:hypothetical protein
MMGKPTLQLFILVLHDTSKRGRGRGGAAYQQKLGSQRICAMFREATMMSNCTLTTTSSPSVKFVCNFHPSSTRICNQKTLVPNIGETNKKHDSNLHLEDRLQICTPARLWEVQFHYSALLMGGRELRLRGKPEADEILLQPGYHSKSCKKVATQRCTTRGD